MHTGCCVQQRCGKQYKVQAEKVVQVQGVEVERTPMPPQLINICSVRSLALHTALTNFATSLRSGGT
jgi:hypothetical protein